MKYKYGVIANIYFLEPQVCQAIAANYKKRKFSGIILNGNFTQRHKEKNKTIYDNYSSKIIEALAKSNLELFVRPDILETSQHEEIMRDLTKKYSNIIDTTKTPLIDKKDHELAFFPGGLLEEQNPQEYFSHNINNVQDITDKIKTPEKAIIFSQTPPLFKTTNAVDYLKMWEIQEEIDFYNPLTKKTQILEPGTIVPQGIMYLINLTKEPIPVFENGGNELLTILYKNKGIQKLILNFQETKATFHDWREKPIHPYIFSKELIANATGYTELIQTEIYLKNDEISYSQRNYAGMHRLS